MTQENPVQQTGMKAIATVQFTLHVHLDDGTVKDIPCIGTITVPPKEDLKGISNDHLGT